MLKKFGRKALSLLLVFVLVATTFFIFDPSILLPKSKAVVDVKKLVSTVEPTVKFYVPEAIYLNPVMGSGAKPTISNILSTAMRTERFAEAQRRQQVRFISHVLRLGLPCRFRGKTRLS